jgi:phosphatidate cytidylyltransferase
MYTSSDNANN